jgi:cold-inducible RNA-binding protein
VPPLTFDIFLYRGIAEHHIPVQQQQRVTLFCFSQQSKAIALYFLFYYFRITMTDRERSRSPEPVPTNGGGDSAPVSNGAPADTGEEVKLYVGNLDYATDEKKLREEFGQFGSVTDVFLPVERGTSRPRGFGFVTMSNRSEAENAISKMDQAQVDGRTIRVNESRPKGEAGPRGPGGGGGSGFNAAGKEDVSVVKERERERDRCLVLHCVLLNRSELYPIVRLYFYIFPPSGQALRW